MDYTTVPRVFSITPDLIADAKLLDIIFSGVSPVAIKMLMKSQTFSAIRDRLPVQIARSTSQGSFQGMAQFDRTVQNPFTYTAYEPRAIYQSVSFVGLEKDINALSGGAAHLDYESALIKNGTDSFMALISEQMFVTGTGNSNQDIIGLQTSISNSGTYAGISRTTYPTWAASQYAIGTNSHSTSIANTDNGFNILRRMLYGGTDAAGNVITRTTYGSQSPTLVVMPMTLWASFEALYTQTVTGSGVGQALLANYAPMVARGSVDRYKAQTSNEVLSGQAGFKAIFFSGVPIIFDEYCPSGTIFFLNENSIEWHGVPASGKNMITYDLNQGPIKVDGPNSNINFSMGVSRRLNIESYNQYGEATDFILHGALEVFNPRFNGIVTGVTN